MGVDMYMYELSLGTDLFYKYVTQADFLKIIASIESN